MSGRALQVGGVAALGIAGYYLYNAGGDPKAAQKRAEADATKLSNEVKDKLPGDAKQVKKDAEVAGQDVRAKADQLAKDARAGADKVDARLESLRQDAAKELDKAAATTQKNVNEAADKFDKGVSEGVQKTKSGVSSWFGGGEKK